MKTIDFKCGNCQTNFPVQIETYKKRLLPTTHSYVQNTISCPSCQKDLPHPLQYLLIQLLNVSDEQSEKWEIGTNFLPPKND